MRKLSVKILSVMVAVTAVFGFAQIGLNSKKAYAETSGFYMENGARLRDPQDNSFGLRFEAVLTEEFYNKIVNENKGEKVIFGISVSNKVPSADDYARSDIAYVSNVAGNGYVTPNFKNEKCQIHGSIVYDEQTLTNEITNAYGGDNVKAYLNQAYATRLYACPFYQIDEEITFVNSNVNRSMIEVAKVYKDKGLVDFNFDQYLQGVVYLKDYTVVNNFDSITVKDQDGDVCLFTDYYKDVTVNGESATLDNEGKINATVNVGESVEIMLTNKSGTVYILNATVEAKVLDGVKDVVLGVNSTGAKTKTNAVIDLGDFDVTKLGANVTAKLGDTKLGAVIVDSNSVTINLTNVSATVFGEKELTITGKNGVVKANVLVITKEITNEEDWLSIGSIGKKLWSLEENKEDDDGRYAINGYYVLVNGIDGITQTSSMYSGELSSSWDKYGFNGVIDGRNYKLTNFTYNQNNGYGIFGATSKNAVIKNIAFEDMEIISLPNAIMTYDDYATYENLYFDFNEFVIGCESSFFDFRTQGEYALNNVVFDFSNTNYVCYCDSRYSITNTTFSMFDSSNAILNNVYTVGAYEDGATLKCVDSKDNKTEFSKTYYTFRNYNKTQSSIGSFTSLYALYNSDTDGYKWLTDMSVEIPKPVQKYTVNESDDVVLNVNKDGYITNPTTDIDLSSLSLDLTNATVSSVKIGENDLIGTVNGNVFTVDVSDLPISCFGEQDLLLELSTLGADCQITIKVTVVTKEIETAQDWLDIPSVGNKVALEMNYDKCNNSINGYFTLKNDITGLKQSTSFINYALIQTDYDPNSLSGFAGTIDGRNHKIINPEFIFGCANVYNGGIFTKLARGSVIKNIAFTDIDNTKGQFNRNGGMLFYRFYGNMENVYFGFKIWNANSYGVSMFGKANGIWGQEINNIIVDLSNANFITDEMAFSSENPAQTIFGTIQPSAYQKITANNVFVIMPNGENTYDCDFASASAVGNRITAFDEGVEFNPDSSNVEVKSSLYEISNEFDIDWLIQMGVKISVNLESQEIDLNVGTDGEVGATNLYVDLSEVSDIITDKVEVTIDGNYKGEFNVVDNKIDLLSEFTATDFGVKNVKIVMGNYEVNLPIQLV